MSRVHAPIPQPDPPRRGDPASRSPQRESMAPAAGTLPQPTVLPTLREMLAHYRQHGTLPGRMAQEEAPPRPPVRRPGSLRELFLEQAAAVRSPADDGSRNR